MYLTKQYGVGLYNLYQKTHRILMVASREFNIYLFSNVEEDGSILILLFSNSDIPFTAASDSVLGGLPLGAALITPDPSNPKKCSIRYHLEIDLGGSIPEFVTKQIVAF